MADQNNPNVPYNPYERGVPANNNTQIWQKQGSTYPPTSQTSQGPPLRTSLKNGVPAGAPGGIQVGTPMDKAPTTPAVNRNPPQGSPY